MAITINGTGTVTGIIAGGLPDAIITQPELATLVIPLGVGQTWQNVSGSRVSGTTYTNSTGRPILVSVGATIWLASAIVDGVSVAVTGTSNVVNVSFVVPAGSTYSATIGSGSINVWAELR